MSAQLLSTATLDRPLIEQAAGQGIVLDVVPFIKITPAIGEEDHTEIEELFSLPITAVFTSARAVRTLQDVFGVREPNWTVYCLSDATRRAVEDAFDESKFTSMSIAADAASLAQMIIDDEVYEVVFFCGDKRMDALPDMLREHDITVHEEVVYHTAETPVCIGKHYDGILFFSPSAVSSFFSLNKVDDDTVLFAIGNTTAASVTAACGRAPLIAGEHSRGSLVAEAITYFKEQAATLNSNAKPNE